ncbi:branched-chain amino acid ABC transporter permease [Aliihoeflea sp. 2WW]|uniref:branched-chain amino acid ABC transporter permease n=1 Tax=Aliihoeflea sp. 2WW TaxID=1381123 RepID=UPI000463A7B3|nr:branched-chain amino acid ABC transporter permease [Aliihoeflea sp. 2WW]
MAILLSWRFTPLLALATLLLVLPLLFHSNLHYRLGALVWTFGLAAIGVNILMGYAGQVSLGHAGFFGIGAYSVAIGPAHFGLAPLFAGLIGVAAAAAIAWIVGKAILRFQGLYLGIATLAFGILVTLVLNNEAQVTGGPDGMQVKAAALFGWRISGAVTWYWVSGAVMLAGAFLALNLHSSPSGRALRALHDSEVAAAVVGVDTARKKLQAFVIAAVYAAVAGAMLALMNGFVTPDVSSLLSSIEMVTMVVIGGMGSIFGSVVGAAFITVLPQLLVWLHDFETAFLGLTIVLFLVLLPAGIVPSLVDLFRRLGR